MNRFSPFFDVFQQWDVGDLTVMNERLHSLMSFDDESREMNDSNTLPTASLPVSGRETGGWTLLDNKSGWKSCPIGIYHPSR